jgi:hypothetical protein
MGAARGFLLRVRNGVSGLGVALIAIRTIGLVLSIAAALLISVSCQKSSDSARWLAKSQKYKSEVMAQPMAAGELKHIEWDGWGWAGQDTTVYLVYDPTDSLAGAAKGQKPGKFNGIPCEVFRIRRLDSYWYTVQFYTNEFWGRRNALNCTGSKDQLLKYCGETRSARPNGSIRLLRLLGAVRIRSTSSVLRIKGSCCSFLENGMSDSRKARFRVLA